MPGAVKLPKMTKVDRARRIRMLSTLTDSGVVVSGARARLASSSPDGVVAQRRVTTSLASTEFSFYAALRRDFAAGGDVAKFYRARVGDGETHDFF